MAKAINDTVEQIACNKTIMATRIRVASRIEMFKAPLIFRVYNTGTPACTAAWNSVSGIFKFSAIQGTYMYYNPHSS